MKNILIVIVFFACASAMAESNITAKQKQLTADLIAVIGGLESLHTNLNRNLQAQLKYVRRSYPNAPEEKFKQYAKDLIVSEDEMVEKIAENLFDMFTLLEVEQLVKFYQSPVGMKWAARKSELSSKNMAIARERFAQMRTRIDDELKDFRTPKDSNKDKAEKKAS